MIEQQITALLTKAAPLRLLSDDDAAKAPLGGIVDTINALRARQAKGETGEALVKPKRGRIEGDDA